jgi:hypothetical protein
LTTFFSYSTFEKLILFLSVRLIRIYQVTIHNSFSKTLFTHYFIGVYIVSSFKFLLKVGVEESIVNALRITDQLFKSNLTFCVVWIFTMQIDEWCVHNRNRLFNANIGEKLKWTPDIFFDFFHSIYRSEFITLWKTETYRVSQNSRIPNSEHGTEGPSGARKILRKKNRSSWIRYKHFNIVPYIAAFISTVTKYYSSYVAVPFFRKNYSNFRFFYSKVKLFSKKLFYVIIFHNHLHHK